MILIESMNVQQLRAHSLDLLSLSSRSLSWETSWLRGVISAADSIDCRLAQMPSQFGGRWDVIKATMFDHYDDIQVAKVWNQHRTIRIILHQSLLQILGQTSILNQTGSDIDFERLGQRSSGLIALMSAEVCASIPFHLRRFSTNGENGSSDAQQVAGACALIWPLESIAKCPYASDEHRRVARDTLKEIGLTIGVREATRKLAGCLDTRPASETL